MQISPETVAVLKNFQSVNASIILRPGKVLRTMNTTKTVFANAEVEEDFPTIAPIHDLQKFLGIISLSKEDTEIEFGDKSMVICSGKSKVKYAYGAENLIVSPPPGKNIKMGKINVSFELKHEVWQQVSNAMSILGFTEFAFIGKDGELSIQALSTRNDSSDTFSTDLGPTDLEFKAIIDAEKMRLIPGDYTVEISKGLAHFKGLFAEYWIAISMKSEFGDATE